MPLIESTPATPPVEQPITVTAFKPAYRGVTVDSQYTPAASLLTNLSGSRMTVTWFSQVVNRDSNLDGQNVTRAAALQPVNRIDNFIIKVTNALTFEQIATNKAVGYTGTANVFPRTVIPNSGDMFLTDIGDGREGIFRATESKRLSIHADTAYEISYVFVAFSDSQQGQEMLADLQAKTIQTYTFMEEFLLYGDNPILVTEDAQLVSELQLLYREVLKDWVESFASNEFQTFMVPGQDFATYDPFLVKAVKSVFDVTEHERFQDMKSMNISGPQDLQQPTIWDTVIKRNKRLLFRANREMGLASTLSFSQNPMYETIRYTGIRYIVYPLGAQKSWDDEMTRTVSFPQTAILMYAHQRRGRLEELVGQDELAGLPFVGLPMIHEVIADPYYIFSQAFYDQEGPKQSRFEAMLWQFINGEALNLPLLKLFAQLLPAWGGLEQFYFTPFLLMMIRDSIKAL